MLSSTYIRWGVPPHVLSLCGVGVWSCIRVRNGVVVDEPARGMRHSAGDDGRCVCALRQEDGARRDVVQVGAFQ